jgi:hypothetical protein
MGVLLEINVGPMAGKKIAIVTGQTVTFGRAAERAEFALPHDTFMSGVHFAVECRPGGCRVQDRKSSNGTFLNGARIQDAMLANGDEVKGGQTIFAVKIVSDAKLAALLPSQDAAPSPVSQERSPASEPMSSFTPGPRPHGAEPAPPPSDPAWSPAAELAQPVPAKQRLPASEAVPPAVRAGLGREPKPASLGAAPDVRSGAPVAESRPSGGGSVAEPEPPSPAMRTADLVDKAVDSRSAPPCEEPPRFHAIPRPPAEEAKAPRVSEPPPGVAPYMAEKFAERPAARGAGGSRGAAFSVMGWSFPAAPAKWLVQEGFGLQQSGHEEFPSSVAATEELLGGITLQQFVESQISMLRGYLRDPKIEPTMPPRVGGADESMAMDVRHSTKDGRELVYRRIYARSGLSVGVLTVTTLAADFPQILQSLQPLLDGAAFRSTVNH